MALSGCFSKSNLGKNQYLLYSQKLKGNKQVSSDNLMALYQQKPNRRILGLRFAPYLWIYNIGKKFYSKDKIQRQIEKTTQKYDKKIAASEGKDKKVFKLKRKKEESIESLNKKLEQGNYLMRVVGEPPAIYDSTLARKTANQMEAYLYSKGYFHGKATYQANVDTARKTVAITYLVTEKEPYKIRQTSHLTNDPRIDSLLKRNKDESLIVSGVNYDEDKIKAERERIDKLLKDNGYFDFSRQYIDFDINDTLQDTIITKKDTVVNNNIIDVRTVINEPANRDRHKVFVIDQINFVIDAGIQRPNAKRDTTLFNGVKYSYYEDKYFKKVLDSKLLFHKGDKYSQTNTIGTQRLLGNLNIFKFANINFDTTGNHFVANVFTSPLEKYQITDEAGFTVLQGLPGPFANVTFRVRNFFNGLEIFETSLRAGIEGQTGFANTSGVYASKELGINSSVIFPQILFPGNVRYKFNPYNPRTRVGLGYNLTDRPEYRRSSLKGSMTYTWQKTPIKSYNLSLIDVNYIFSNIKDTIYFKPYLDQQAAQGNPLFQSFNNSFVSSINGFYLYNDNVIGQNKQARYFRLFLETGGTTLNLFPRADVEKLEKNINMRYFSFFKINPDFRYYLPTSKRSTLAFRINAGVAIPYGHSETLPYEKFFFAGGSNSLRAWQPRRLGPGKDTLNRISNYLYEQPGNIILEANAEYRFKMVSFINGALFIDAGNVWTLNNKAKPDGQFKFNTFFQQIAVGTGAGLRFDFSFLILRLDVGIKVYDPSRDPGERFVAKKFSWGNAFHLDNPYRALLNLGIGYPF